MFFRARGTLTTPGREKRRDTQGTCDHGIEAAFQACTERERRGGDNSQVQDSTGMLKMLKIPLEEHTRN